MFIFHVDSGRRTNGKMLKGKSGVARANDNEKRAPTQMDLGVVENPLNSAAAEFFRKNKGGKFRSSLSFPRVDSNIHFFLSFLLFLLLCSEGEGNVRSAAQKRQNLFTLGGKLLSNSFVFVCVIVLFDVKNYTIFICIRANSSSRTR